MRYLMLLALLSPCAAQSTYWAAVGAYSASVAADVATTQAYDGPGCHEQNSWLYGRKPTLAVTVPLSAGIGAGTIWASHRMVRSRHRVERGIGYGLLGLGMVGHGRAAVGNARVRCR